MDLVIEMVSRRLTNIPHAGWAMRISDEMTIEKTHPTLLKILIQDLQWLCWVK